MNKRYAISIAQIGRFVVVAIPEVDFVTIIFPFPCNGTTQLSGTFDYVINAIEQRKARELEAQSASFSSL